MSFQSEISLRWRTGMKGESRWRGRGWGLGSLKDGKDIVFCLPNGERTRGNPPQSRLLFVAFCPFVRTGEEISQRHRYGDCIEQTGETWMDKSVFTSWDSRLEWLKSRCSGKYECKGSIQVGGTKPWHLSNEMIQMMGQDRELCGSTDLQKRQRKLVICKVNIGRPKSRGWILDLREKHLPFPGDQGTRRYEKDRASESYLSPAG